MVLKIAYDLDYEADHYCPAYKIDEYNVGEISDYALRMYRQGRFDEVEAEYQTYRGR